MKKYILNNQIPSMGVFREDFVSPFEAYVLASSQYNAKELQSLLQFDINKKDYFYEDENIIIIDSTEPTSQSSISITIKPVFFFETDEVIVHLDTNPQLKIVDSLNMSISYKICYKKSGKNYDGCFITPNYFIGMLERIKTDEQRIISQDFLLPRLNIEIVKEISFNYVKYLLTKIIREDYF